MGCESFDVVRFDLGPLFQDQMRTAKLKISIMLQTIFLIYLFRVLCFVDVLFTCFKVLVLFSQFCVVLFSLYFMVTFCTLEYELKNK